MAYIGTALMGAAAGAFGAALAYDAGLRRRVVELAEGAIDRVTSLWS